MTWLRDHWMIFAAVFGVGVAWSTYGQQVEQNSAHREAVRGLPEAVLAIQANVRLAQCIDTGWPREYCWCEFEETTRVCVEGEKKCPDFGRCEAIKEWLIREGRAERVQTVVPDTGGS